MAVAAPAQGDGDAQLFAQTRTLWAIQGNGLNLSTVTSASPLRAFPILPADARWAGEALRTTGGKTAVPLLFGGRW